MSAGAGDEGLIRALALLSSLSATLRVRYVATHVNRGYVISKLFLLGVAL